jgi:hypothetical protein
MRCMRGSVADPPCQAIALANAVKRIGTDLTEKSDYTKPNLTQTTYMTRHNPRRSCRMEDARQRATNNPQICDCRARPRLASSRPRYAQQINSVPVSALRTSKFHRTHTFGEIAGKNTVPGPRILHRAPRLCSKVRKQAHSRILGGLLPRSSLQLPRAVLQA